MFLEETKPAFLRFPGGNNMYVSLFLGFLTRAVLIYRSEGLSVGSRWIWNQTIGPVVDRPGRDGMFYLAFVVDCVD